MSSLMSKIGTTAKAFGHYIEQRDVILKVEKQIPWIGAAGLVAIGGADIYKAKPEERKQVMIRDGLVLGATALGTLVAAKGLRIKGLPRFNAIMEKIKLNGLMKFNYEENKKEATKYFKDAAERMFDYTDKDGKLIKTRVTKAVYTEAEADRVKNFWTKKRDFSEFKKLIKLIKEREKADLPIILPVELGEDYEGKTILGKFLNNCKDDGKQMLEFFTVGLISVLSGLGGGYAANKINKVTDPDANVNMVKEGIFQFIANIALCAVGAGLALCTLNIPPIKNKLSQMAAGKVLRTGGILAGLSIGILGGSVAANWLGRNYINPWFDKLQGKAPQPGQGKRKVEFSDAILHLDDLPTALALAGVAIMEPFIPLFFAFSGYRTGIGYRNDHNTSTTPKESKGMPDLASSFGPADLGAMAQASGTGSAAPNPAAQPSVSPLSALAAASAPVGAFAANRPASPFAASSQLAGGVPSFQPQPQPAGV